MIRLKVKEIAKRKKISQRQIFLKTGIDINTVRRILQNPYTNVELITLDKLAKLLEVDASELIESVPDDAAQQP